MLRILFIILAINILSSFITSSKEMQVPFCGFSLYGGFYGKPAHGELQFITKEAKNGDGSGIPEIVATIEEKLGFNVLINIYISDSANNCFATTGQGGSRLMIANADFLDEVNNKSETRWAAISVIAHEIGHHIAGFNNHQNVLDDELDADYWSGYALNRLGASINASTKCIMKFGTEEDTYSHPNKYRRADVIRKGWNDAKDGIIDYTKCQNCKP